MKPGTGGEASISSVIPFGSTTFGADALLTGCLGGLSLARAKLTKDTKVAEQTASKKMRFIHKSLPFKNYETLQSRKVLF